MNCMAITLTSLVLLAATCTDIWHRRVPNLLSYFGIAIAICIAVVVDWNATVESDIFSTTYTSVNTNFPEMQPNQIIHENKSAQAKPLATYRSLSGALGCFAVLLLVYVVGGIGGGDVKLGAFMGAANGFEAAISMLVVGHLLAGVFALLCIIRNRRSLVNSRGIPMAVFYSIGTLLVISGM